MLKNIPKKAVAVLLVLVLSVPVIGASESLPESNDTFTDATVNGEAVPEIENSDAFEAPSDFEAPTETEAPSDFEASAETEASADYEVPAETEIFVEAETPTESELPAESEASAESEHSTEPEVSADSELPAMSVSTAIPDVQPEDSELLPTAHDPIISEAPENEGGGEIGEKPVTEVENGVLLDVPYINQRNGFPNGCESVSTVMALQYLGVDIDPNTFIEKYLDMGRSLYWKNGEANACDPREMFPGDPRNDSGWGCYPEVIKKAVDKMELENYEAIILKDTPLSTLCSEYIDNGIPVVFWGTIDMRKPSSWVTWRIDDGSDRTHTWTSPFHCLLLVGYDKENYYFNDPWRQKNKKYGRKAVEIAYSGLGREALVILEK